MSRQIILDTETTGIHVDQGHRIIEIGCLEMINRRLTGERFHTYLNPEREVEEGARAVHGISTESLRDKPLFAEVAAKMMEFLDGAELIIHNAPFDVGFINRELQLTKGNWQPLTSYCKVLDTLALARKMHAGARNSLDALCKRYGVDNSNREFHGALLDAYLLAQVYLAMTEGQRSLLESLEAGVQSTTETPLAPIKRSGDLLVIKPSPEEEAAHQEYLQKMAKQGKCLWSERRDG